MEQQLIEASNDPAVAAFDGVRAEMTLLRLAVQKLVSEREDINIPDYSESLSNIIKRGTDHSQWLKQIGESPALSQTAKTIATQIVEQGKIARAEEAKGFEDARNGLINAANIIIERINSARQRDAQDWQLLIVGAASALLFTLLGTILPDIVHDIAPSAWHWPEKSAARSLGLSLTNAGVQLISAEDPDFAQTLIQTSQIIQDNQQTLKTCTSTAAQTQKPTKCTIIIKPEK